MGYSTRFQGMLKFTHELTMQQLKRLSAVLGEDPDDHPEWADYADCGEVSYIQWKVTKDLAGIQWDGHEKFYHAVNSVNLLLAYMREDHPDFGLTGELLAQGEEIRDRWILAIDLVTGKAIKRKVDLGSAYECPHCREEFLLSDAKLVKEKS